MASDDEVSLDVIEMNRVNDAVGSNVFDNDVTAVAVRLSEETQQALAVVEEKRSKIVAYFVTTLLFTALTGLTVVLLLSQSPFPSTKETDYASDVSYFDSLFEVLSESMETDPFLYKDTLNNPMAPQYLALEWMAFRDEKFFPFLEYSSSIPPIEVEQVKQRFALVTLFYAAGIQDDWLRPGTHECQFIGVTCGDKDIFDVQLNRLGMTGSLPNELGWLTHLRTMSMRENRLQGTIPSGIQQLVELEQLVLTSNKLEGVIGPLPPNLQLLDLRGNALTGSLPSWPLSLQIISLGSNEFTGTLPLFESNNELVYFDVANTFITGTLPTSIGLATNLGGLSIHETFLEGTLPSEIGSLTLLHELSMAVTKLRGTLPSELFQLSNLEWLVTIHTKFHGTLSTLFGNLTNLRVLNLMDGQFTGSLPSELGMLQNLAWLQLTGNQLTGMIPHELSEATALGKFF